jgi:hypothetical protein
MQRRPGSRPFLLRRISSGCSPVFVLGALPSLRLTLHSRRFTLRTGENGFIFVFMLHTCGRIVFPRFFAVLPLVRSMKIVVFMLLPLVRSMILPIFAVLPLGRSMNPSVFAVLPTGRSIFPFFSPVLSGSCSGKQGVMPKQTLSAAARREAVPGLTPPSRTSGADEL